MGEEILALDIGGTKIAAGLVDGQGVLTHRRERPTPDGDAEDVWAAVAGVLDDVRVAGGLVDFREVSAVGVGSAGPIDVRNGTVSPINIPQWDRFPVLARVAGATGLPVRLGGDGLCTAMGEWWRGAGRDARFLLGMVVSTGIGGGLVLDGKPFHGRSGNAGHVGHVVVEPDGALCTCGGHGCAEIGRASCRERVCWIV